MRLIKHFYKDCDFSFIDEEPLSGESAVSRFASLLAPTATFDSSDSDKSEFEEDLLYEMDLEEL